jgi:hypothetical protein
MSDQSLPLIPKNVRTSMTETDIRKDIEATINRTGWARVWPNKVGALPDRNGRWVHYGLAIGSADLIGMVCGRFLSLEVKRPGHEQDDNPKTLEAQRLWSQVMRDGGAVHAQVTSAAEAMAVILEARAGKR